ncbi:hypothetical protein AGMMS49975_19520 [Clostridia bacterium]|nr:hypothetical protein AGMMS49975_19520 [Clostridia bacterium]
MREVESRIGEYENATIADVNDAIHMALYKSEFGSNLALLFEDVERLKGDIEAVKKEIKGLKAEGKKKV